jgi:hypothetical protein
MGIAPQRNQTAAHASPFRRRGLPGFGEGLSSQEKADVLAFLKTL